jgi:hypothetical protein
MQESELRNKLDDSFSGSPSHSSATETLNIEIKSNYAALPSKELIS